MAEYPHCNTTTIHAPGECHYCDMHPDLQEARSLSGVPFSSNEANGWSGNVAVKAGERHTHLGATYTVGAAPTAHDELVPVPWAQLSQAFQDLTLLHAMTVIRRDCSCATTGVPCKHQVNITALSPLVERRSTPRD